jgi:soluble lytic murein transglycosylase-like protein
MPIETADLDAIIRADAAKYGVDEAHLYATIKCESNFDVDARGDHGLARGLAQIRSDYHPEVSDKEADDPAFAIDYMAKQFAAGHANEWSCWRSLFGSG